MVRLLYGQKVSDEATCYKAIRTGLMRRLNLRCERVEFCPEVTAKLCRMGIRIREVPISYTPRGSSEGKKIGWRDGVRAIITLIRWRLEPFQPKPEGYQESLEPVVANCSEVTSSSHFRQLTEWEDQGVPRSPSRHTV
jgi:hypothetical protein